MENTTIEKETFEEYLTKARYDFVKTIVKSYNVEQHLELRTSVDDILIAYDQARNEIAQLKANTKIVTDNSKVNTNLLKEVERLEEKVKLEQEYSKRLEDVILKGFDYASTFKDNTCEKYLCERIVNLRIRH